MWVTSLYLTNLETISVCQPIGASSCGGTSRAPSAPLLVHIPFSYRCGFACPELKFDIWRSADCATTCCLICCNVVWGNQQLTTATTTTTAAAAAAVPAAANNCNSNNLLFVAKCCVCRRVLSWPTWCHEPANPNRVKTQRNVANFKWNFSVESRCNNFLTTLQL